MSMYREPIATMIRQQTEEYAELLSIDMMDEMENDADVQDAIAEEEKVDADEEQVDKENGESEKEEQEEQEKVETGMEADARVIINVSMSTIFLPHTN
ncbi:hypothetical protein QFC22_004265 [Naganishia vaughanmartiniae]|uniref:Uncharacterized protein n=1 Tax=Naganishia vaughanmartiniae TaxID=1424756 RepID=A0ACC2X4T0_9TREE|nr:hypothetical protein QFC22_004265 [Naganishia vaughanmartiniae]